MLVLAANPAPEGPGPDHHHDRPPGRFVPDPVTIVPGD